MLSWRVQVHARPSITLSSPSSSSQFKFKFHPPRRKVSFSAIASGDARCSLLSLDSKSETYWNFIGELMERQHGTKEEDFGEFDNDDDDNEDDDDEEEEEEVEYDDDEDKQVIQVPRQKHIPVSKSRLLDAILVTLFQNDSEQDVFHFLQVSSCLDSILHAEHKQILEEMRADYSAFVLPKAKDKDDHSNNSRWRRPPSTSSDRVGAATRFQRAFMQLLCEAQFEELSTRDLMLTSALNTDYLLTLPIYVDWNKVSDSNVIIFRRGYATERQEGLLLGDKLDYLQSKLLQRLFFVISKPLAKIATWMIQRFQVMFSIEQLKGWSNNMKKWLLEASDFEQLYLYKKKTYDSALEITDEELPVRLAAQRAVPRYEGFLSSAGPRGRLLRKLLTWTGFIPPPPETQYKLENEVNVSEPYLRPMLLSRISLGDIWKPARKFWFRNDLWEALKTSISILLSQSILQEAAFEELVLLYMNKVDNWDVDDEIDIVSLQLKIYEKIPIPDLPVIFPHKKLSFRILDTVRLDAATVLGLLAYIINYKFEDILSSPSAIFLDVIAISALVIFISRVALGYKQTWDRYQLLVNRTLYEKTLASGFGSVHFLLDASEQQQYKEAVLAYAVLLKANNNQALVRQSLRDNCEKFMYDMFREKVDMPIDEAMDTLLRFGLVNETFVNGYSSLRAIPCAEAHKALTERWNSLL